MEQQNTDEIRITEVKIRLADSNRTSLVGWASCIVNDALLLDSIRIMRNSEGAIYLQFPVKKFRGSVKYYHFRPISHEAGDVFKQAILDELKRNGSDAV